jgi:hypothetical protein
MFFVRNTAAGRQLIADWLAIAMSGQIQCHGFDQAALAMLIFQRLHQQTHTQPHTQPHTQQTHPPTVPMTMTAPFNFTCLHDAVRGEFGCNDESVWSCDFRFEQTLFDIGFRVNDHKFYTRTSSYTSVMMCSVVLKIDVIASCGFYLLDVRVCMCVCAYEGLCECLFSRLSCSSGDRDQTSPQLWSLC